MKDRILYVLCGLILVDIGFQSLNLYRQSTPKPPKAFISAPPGTTIDVTERRVEGSSGQKAILVEFSDFECPYCARHANGVLKELRERFVMTGRLQYAFANNPLAIHPNARMLATAGVCAAKQDRFWDFHDALFQRKLKTEPQVMMLAEELGLNLPRFETCLRDTNTSEEIEKDIEQAQKLDFSGTPAFAIGTVESTGRVTVETLVRGAQPLSVFESAIKTVSAKTP